MNDIHGESNLFNADPLADALDFLKAIEPRDDQDFLFQTFDDDKTKKEKREELTALPYGSMSTLATELTALNRAGAGIFVTVNRTFGAPRKTEDVIGVRALFVDLDGAPLENAEKLGLKPTVVVESSPGRHQVYWRAPWLDVSEFKSTMLRLAALTGGDPAVADLPRVMRLPGFKHQKDPDHPSTVRIRELNQDAQYTRDQILDALVKAEAQCGVERKSERRASDATTPATAADFDEVKSALGALPIKEFANYPDWLEIGMAIHHASGGSDAGHALFDEWSAGDPDKCNAREIVAKWRSFSDREGGVTAATIFKHAHDRGWRYDPLAWLRELVARPGRPLPPDWLAKYSGNRGMGYSHDPADCLYPEDEGHGCDKEPSPRAASGDTAVLAPSPRGETHVFESWSAFEPQSYRWLWRHWLAKGELHLKAGAVSAGKTTIALSFAATITSGGKWPDGSFCEKGNVFFWSGEDSIDKGLLPRFLAMGGDTRRIGGIRVLTEDGKTRPFDPATDIEHLRKTLEDHKRRREPITFMVIDPFIVVARTDSHKNAETRRDMQPLVELAREFDVAVLGVTHFSKGTQKQAITERVTGSLAFAAQARAVFAAVVNSDEDDRATPGA
jgi:hypothetical protein